MKTYGVTLTENRKDRERYQRYVVYRRRIDDVHGIDVVDAYLVHRFDGLPDGIQIEELPWDKIQLQEPDPELVAQWLEHVQSQATARDNTKA